MEKKTLLVKGNIYCKRYISSRETDLTIPFCDPEKYKYCDMIIEGDMHIDSMVVFGNIRVIATGAICSKGENLVLEDWSEKGENHE